MTLGLVCRPVAWKKADKLCAGRGTPQRRWYRRLASLCGGGTPCRVYGWHASPHGGTAQRLRRHALPVGHDAAPRLACPCHSRWRRNALPNSARLARRRGHDYHASPGTQRRLAMARLARQRKPRTEAGPRIKKHGPRGSKGCGSRRHDHLFRRGRDRFVAAPARSQNGGRLPYKRVCAFPLSYYNYHWNAVSGAFSNAKTFLRLYLDAYHGDNLFFDSSSPHRNLPDSGWHCSYCFSMDGILLKLRSFEHTDLNRAPFNEPSHISHHIQLILRFTVTLSQLSSSVLVPQSP